MAKGLFNQQLPKETKRSRFGFAHPDTEAIYCAYPKLRAPGRAEKAIEKALKEIAADLLLAKVKAYAQSVKDDPPKYIPHPATWFNDRRWLDVAAKPKASYHEAMKRQTDRERRERVAEDARVKAASAELTKRLADMTDDERRHLVAKAVLRLPVFLRLGESEEPNIDSPVLRAKIREVLDARDSVKGKNDE